MNPTSTLHLGKIPRTKKGAWVYAARSQGLSLRDWVAQALDAEAERATGFPAWTHGLSPRTATCLVRAGFESREQVVKAWDDFEPTWWLSAEMQNFGPRCFIELEEWLND